MGTRRPPRPDASRAPLRSSPGETFNGGRGDVLKFTGRPPSLRVRREHPRLPSAVPPVPWLLCPAQDARGRGWAPCLGRVWRRAGRVLALCRAPWDAPRSFCSRRGRAGRCRLRLSLGLRWRPARRVLCGVGPRPLCRRLLLPQPSLHPGVSTRCPSGPLARLRARPRRPEAARRPAEPGPPGLTSGSPRAAL